MKRSKKFFTTVLTLLFVLAANVFAFASYESDLIKSLNALGITDTGLITQHLQTITLSESEAEKVQQNINLANSKLAGVTSPSEISQETLLEISNLALESAQILQMDIKFTNEAGEPISLSDINLQDGSFVEGFQVVITDSKGATLAVVNPEASDLAGLTSVVQQLNQVVEDAQQYSAQEFKPENGGKLPDTAAPYANNIIVGAVLMALSVLGLAAQRKKQAA